MPNETLTFNFLLTVIDRCELTLTAGDQSLTQAFENLGPTVFPITFQTNINQYYEVKLKTSSTGPVALINNVEVVWHDEHKILPAWRVPGNNEIWDYIDPDATRKAQAFESNPILRTMSLDYRLDRRMNGYLNNYAKFVKESGEKISLVDNKQDFWLLNEPGYFSFEFKAPISYWLFKRLFARPVSNNQSQG